MIGYIARRLLVIIPVWAGVLLIAFLLVHAIPGGPFDTGAIRSPEATAFLEERYNLDKPLFQQFGLYLGGVVQGDLGESMVRRGVSVTDQLSDRVPVSLTLGLCGLFVAMVVGIPIGVLAAVRANRALDHVLMISATAAYAIPTFVLALVLMLTFGLRLGWLPLGGWGSPSQAVLPALALGLPWSGLLARMTRAAMLDVLSEDYVRTARAKGAGPVNVVMGHAFPNALIPLSTVVAILAAELIVGSLVVEKIFGIPGVGALMVESVLGSDYTMTLGVIVFYATTIFAANFLADIGYALIDPRVRLG
jgi:oligopeptide transport system permease protein